MADHQPDASTEDLGRLARGVAHDVKNLIGVIANHTHFVAEAVGPASRGDEPLAWDVMQADLGEIAQAAARVARTTDRLVALDWWTDTAPAVFDPDEVV